MHIYPSSFSQRFLSGLTALTLGLSQLSLGVAGKTVHQQLEEGITYVKGNFEYEKDGESYYTVPYKPHHPPQQSIKIYEGRPKEMPYETLLKRVVRWKDGRERVTETTQWPYLFHSQLSLHFSDGEYGGSGILVGPQHLLTAGHNVYNHKTKEWVTHIIARLGLNDTVVPFGDLKTVEIYTFEEWIDMEDPNFDMALLTLNKPIGLQTGWCGLLCLEDNDLFSEKVHITGYPGDKGLKQMWSMTHAIKKVEPERIFYEIDTYGGQSGSGIWIKKWGSPYNIGIHTLGEGEKYKGNSGVRLSQRKFIQVIEEWIFATRDIQTSILRQIAVASRANTPHLSNPTLRRTSSSSQENPASNLAQQERKISSHQLSQEPEEQTKPAAAAGQASLSLLQQGDVFYKAGNLAAALKVFNEAAWEGNGDAQKRLKRTAERMLQKLPKEENHNPRATVLTLFEQNRTQAELDLSGDKIDRAGAAVLAAVLPQTSVTTLNLSFNYIDDIGAEALSKNTLLTVLNLSENQIGPKGAEALSKNTTLTTLDLGGGEGDRHGNDNYIGDAGAEAFSKNTTLTTLNLRYNNIGDAGAMVLVKALPQMSLESLNLEKNKLSGVVKQELSSKIYRNSKGEEVKIDW